MKSDLSSACTYIIQSYVRYVFCTAVKYGTGTIRYLFRDSHVVYNCTVPIALNKPPPISIDMMVCILCISLHPDTNLEFSVFQTRNLVL